MVKRFFLILLTVCTIATLSACSNVKGAFKSSSSLTNFLGLTENPDWYIRSKHRYGDSRWIPNDFGLEMHYRDVGDKEDPVIVLLHSEMASLHSYQAWIELLSEDYRVIAVDLPGSGLTGAPHCVKNIYKTCSENLSLTYIRHTMQYFIEDMRLSRFTLVGNSMSGYLAAQYAIDNPHRVEKLVLVSPLGMQQEIPWIVNYMTVKGMDIFNQYMQPSTAISNILDEFYGDRANLKPSVLARYIHLNQSEGAFESNVRMMQLVKRMMESPLELKISEISVPTLIIWGKQNTWVKPEHAKLWSEQIKDSVLLQYAFIGHLPMEENGKQSAHDVLAFIKEEPIPSLTGLGTGGSFTVKDAAKKFDKEALFGNKGEPVEETALPGAEAPREPEQEMEIAE